MSTLKVNTLQTAAGVEVYTAKAWVNFNGTGTVAIRASGNVSSITDNGTGDYTVNFTTAMPDANYATSMNSTQSFNGYVTATTTTCRLNVGFPTTGGGATLQDQATISVAIFR